MIQHSIDHGENLLELENFEQHSIMRPMPRIGKVIVLHKDDEDINNDNNFNKKYILIIFKQDTIL